MSTLSRERRERILVEVRQKRHVAARDLAVALTVSEATVRRDLRALSDSGEVELVYGGATLRRPGDGALRPHAARNLSAKRLIGQVAAELVGDDEQVFLDSGTTCFEMAPHLKRRRGLSIIVNSARLALELDAPGLSVIALGGLYRPERMDTVGPLAIATLEQLRGYVCFIGADGLSMEFGLAAADIESAHLYRRAVLNAKRTVLLVDHSKFLAPSLFKIVDWQAIAAVVTDQPPSDEWREFFRGRGIEVMPPAGAEKPAEVAASSGE